ncbi:hypothetical protein BDM02DRAFT_3111508 [Thelephora ganbajun]|uniref:Uncharacterized protein n=1 Tax=Thelephora ganbajun TaxID=370292 RepID=A0ACB6ZMW4_THEGA|nr:hypothetical protein BDM02DRAFT_3111508 [Thelephora ganbajun]
MEQCLLIAGVPTKRRPQSGRTSAESGPSGAMGRSHQTAGIPIPQAVEAEPQWGQHPTGKRTIRGTRRVAVGGGQGSDMWVRGIPSHPRLNVNGCHLQQYVNYTLTNLLYIRDCRGPLANQVFAISRPPLILYMGRYKYYGLRKRAGLVKNLCNHDTFTAGQLVVLLLDKPPESPRRADQYTVYVHYGGWMEYTVDTPKTWENRRPLNLVSNGKDVEATQDRHCCNLLKSSSDHRITVGDFDATHKGMHQNNPRQRQG